MRYSNNVINNCLLAWAVDQGDFDPAAGVGRVKDHYASCYSEDLEVESHLGEGLGMALVQRPETRLRWPLWACDEENVVATIGLPVGWSSLVGGSETTAPQRLASKLSGDPDLIAELVPPVVVAIASANGTRLTVLNDVVGVGRLYEMRCAWGRAWSNRLGALPVFASERARTAASSWRVLAAAGWFLGAGTPLKDCSKVPPGSRIVVNAAPAGAAITRAGGDLRGPLVTPRRTRLDLGGRQLARSADAASERLTGMARELGTAWDAPLAVSLTGGRDSRVSAAATVAAGIGASFNTGDQVPGEVEAVRNLIDHAPAAMEHTVHAPPGDDHAGDAPPLLERVAQIHLVHDGMRNPQEIRRSVAIPHGPPPPPTLSGHGGELGHGFYYGEKKKLKRLLRGGEEALMGQLEKNARRKHSAATPESYANYLSECEATLETGREFGLSGPPLLDWFYMAQRLPYRSGLGARTGRWSACVTPTFVRGAFDLTPRERLSARFHRLVIERLVPEWADVPFFKEADAGAALPEIRRKRIWEKDSDATEVEEILSGGNSWPEIFDRERVLQMWSEVRSGGGSADYEHIFDRIVWREAFEAHVAELNRAAVAAP